MVLSLAVSGWPGSTLDAVRVREVTVFPLHRSDRRDKGPRSLKPGSGPRLPGSPPGLRGVRVVPLEGGAWLWDRRLPREGAAGQGPGGRRFRASILGRELYHPPSPPRSSSHQNKAQTLRRGLDLYFRPPLHHPLPHSSPWPLRQGLPDFFQSLDYPSSSSLRAWRAREFLSSFRLSRFPSDAGSPGSLRTGRSERAPPASLLRLFS